MRDTFKKRWRMPQRSWRRLRLASQVRWNSSQASGFSPQKSQEDKTYHAYLMRVTQGPVTSSAKLSVNLGDRRAKEGGTMPIPDLVTQDVNYQEALGRYAAQVVSLEMTTHRKWWSIDGVMHDYMQWDRDTRPPTQDPHLQVSLTRALCLARSMGDGRV